MARQRKDKALPSPPSSTPISLQQPDRSGPSEATLLHLAEERKLFAMQDERKRKAQEEAAVMSPGAERFLEATLWTATLAMVHFTFDVLVQHQYGTEIDWPAIWVRTGRAWIVFLFLFYALHPHESQPILLPGLPLRYQRSLRQTIFFAMSVLSGCSLIYITNTYGYLATMKRAPPLGCLWLWAVVELDLAWAALSLVGAAAFLWQGGYDVK